MVTWNPEILDRWIAPGYSEFTRAEVPDLRTEFPQGQHWIANQFLNSVLGTGFIGVSRSIMLNVVIRAHRAFASYHEAKDKTEKFLEAKPKDGPHTYSYHDALSSWEAFVINTQIAMELLRNLNDAYAADKFTFFQKGDSSKEERIWNFANLIKHFPNELVVGNDPFAVAEHEKQTASQHNVMVPLWLDNSGLNSSFGGGVQLSYVEAAEILRELAQDADELSNPRGMVEKQIKERSSLEES